MGVVFVCGRHRRVVALAVLVPLLVSLLPRPAGAAAPSPSTASIAPPSLAQTAALAAAVQGLRQTVDSLLALADQPGGLYEWKARIRTGRDAVLQAFPAAARELQTLQAYLQARHLPDVTVARAGSALQDLQGQVPALLEQLGQLLQVPQDSTDVPGLLKQVAARLDGWQPAAPSPPDDRDLPFGPQSGLSGSPPSLALAPGATPAPLTSGPPTPGDLERLPGPDLLPNLGTDGQTPAGIIRWVYQHVRLQWYAGSAKTPETVLAEGAGNDTDLATLTVALLRAAGVPARWGYGVVGLPPGDWTALTSLKSSDAAARFLRAAGLPVTARTDPQDETVRLDLPHTWVEAQLTPGQWVAIDPAWKAQQPAGSAQPLPATFDLNQYLLRGQGRSPLAFWENATAGTPADDDAPLPAPPSPALLAAGALPPLAWSIVGGGRTYTVLPAEWQGLVQISVGSLYAQIPLAGLVARRLTLVFLPATPDDQQVADAWRFTDSPPLFLQRVRPLLLLDGQPVGALAGGGDLAPGETVTLHASVQLGAGRDSFTRLIHAGDTVGISIAPQPVSEDVSTARAQAAIQTPWTTAESLLGSRLRALGQEYLRRVDRATALVALRSGVPVVPGVRVALTSFSHKVSYLGDLPLALAYGGVAVDAARVTNSPVSPSGNDQDERVLSLLLAAQESYAEGEVFQPFLGSAGDSTVSLLQERTGSGGHLQYLCSCKPGEAPTGLSAAANDRIAQAIAQGYAAIAATTPVGGHDVYVIVDPRTGASGFALGSGNGGLWDYPKELLEKAKDALLKQIIQPIMDGLGLSWASVRGLVLGTCYGFVFSAKGEYEGIRAIVTNGDSIIALLMDLVNPFDPESRSDLRQRLELVLKAIAAVWHNIDLSFLANAGAALNDYIVKVSGYEYGSDQFEAFKGPFIGGFIVGIVAEIGLTSWIAETWLVPLLTTTTTELSAFIQGTLQDLNEFRIAAIQRFARTAATEAAVIRADAAAAEMAAGIDPVVAAADGAQAGARVIEDLAGVRAVVGPGARAVIDRLDDMFGELRGLGELRPDQEAQWIQDIVGNVNADPRAEPFIGIIQGRLDALNATLPPEAQVTFQDWQLLRSVLMRSLSPEQQQLVRDVRAAIGEVSQLVPGGEMQKGVPLTKLPNILKSLRAGDPPQVWGWVGSRSATADASTPSELSTILRLDYPGSEINPADGVILLRSRTRKDVTFLQTTFEGYPNVDTGFPLGRRNVPESKLSAPMALQDGGEVVYFARDGTQIVFGEVTGESASLTNGWEAVKAKFDELEIKLEGVE